MRTLLREWRSKRRLRSMDNNCRSDLDKGGICSPVSILSNDDHSNCQVLNTSQTSELLLPKKKATSASPDTDLFLDLFPDYDSFDKIERQKLSGSSTSFSLDQATSFKKNVTSKNKWNILHKIKRLHEVKHGFDSNVVSGVCRESCPCNLTKNENLDTKFLVTSTPEEDRNVDDAVDKFYSDTVKRLGDAVLQHKVFLDNPDLLLPSTPSYSKQRNNKKIHSKDDWRSHPAIPYIKVDIASRRGKAFNLTYTKDLETVMKMQNSTSECLGVLAELGFDQKGAFNCLSTMVMSYKEAYDCGLAGEECRNQVCWSYVQLKDGFTGIIRPRHGIQVDEKKSTEYRCKFEQAANNFQQSQSQNICTPTSVTRLDTSVTDPKGCQPVTKNVNRESHLSSPKKRIRKLSRLAEEHINLNDLKFVRKLAGSARKTPGSRTASGQVCLESIIGKQNCDAKIHDCNNVGNLYSPFRSPYIVSQN